jgi:hypothetical protein
MVAVITETPANTRLQPTVIIATSRCWPTPLRFAESLAECGGCAHLLSPRRNSFVYGMAAECRHAYGHLRPQSSLLRSILRIGPSLVVPGDERVIAEMVSLCNRRLARFGPGDDVVRILRASLGKVDSYGVLMQRARFIAEAGALGIRVPATREIPSAQALAELAKEIPFPVVIKLDGTSGGSGTVVVRDAKDALVKFQMLRSLRRRMEKKLGSALRGEGSVVAGFGEWRTPVLNLQAHVQGRSVTTAFACWEGRLIGAIHAEVVQEAWANGPATVIRLISDPEMEANAELIASRFGLSGLHGLDYMRDSSGRLWLIEINPRLTQIAHLALGPGRDLAAALLACATGQPVAPRPVKIDSDLVALFPQEWLRDRNSDYLRTAYHNVPSNNPDFVRAVLGRTP